MQREIAFHARIGRMSAKDVYKEQATKKGMPYGIPYVLLKMNYSSGTQELLLELVQGHSGCLLCTIVTNPVAGVVDVNHRDGGVGRCI